MARHWMFVGVLTLTLSSVCGQYYDFLYYNLKNNSPAPTVPKPNATANVIVHIGLTVRRLRHIDPESLTVEMETWLSLKWSNSMVSWLPQAYNGIEKLSIQLDDFWRPDILMYYSPDDVTYSDVNAVINSTGYVFHDQPARIRTMCDSGPAGSVVCELTFGSWTYSMNDLDLQFDPETGLDVSNLKENPKWVLAEHSKRREEFKEDCCPEIYVTVIYGFTFVPRG